MNYEDTNETGGHSDANRVQELSAELIEQLQSAVDNDNAACMNVLAYTLVCLCILTIAGEDGNIDEVRRGEARKEIQLLVGEMFDNIMSDETDE